MQFKIYLKPTKQKNCEQPPKPSQLDRVNKMLHSIGLLLMLIVYILLVLSISGLLAVFGLLALGFCYHWIHLVVDYLITADMLQLFSNGSPQLGNSLTLLVPGISDPRLCD